MRCVFADGAVFMNDRDLFSETLLRAVEALPLSLSPDAAATMWRHFDLVSTANRQFNLTRITDPAGAAVKHYADSLSVWAWAKGLDVAINSVLDVGTGAGFPAIPLAIACRDWCVTAIDATAKKIRFVEECVRQLDLGNVQAEHRRLDRTIAQRETYDAVLFKAVGKIDRCLQQSAGNILPGAHVVCFKTGSIDRTEIELAGRAARLLGFESQPAYEYNLPLGDEVLARQLVVYRRVACPL